MNRFFLTLPVFLILFVMLGAGCSGQSSEPDIIIEDAEPIILDEDQNTSMPQTKSYAFPGVLSQEEITGKQIRLTTAKGDIVFELFSDTAPKTVSNFVYLTQEGFYDGIIFHRREEGFVIQGGDPNGNGTGGPGYTFEDEFGDSYTYERGMVAMANRGPNTNGSQFFIMLADTPLPKAYTIFGRVTEGMEIVDEIEIGDEMKTVVVEEKEVGE